MIKLNNDYFIHSDGVQYRLKKRVISTKKETDETYENEVTLGYYGDLKQALLGYCRIAMIDKVYEEDMTLLQVRESIDKLREEIRAYV